MSARVRLATTSISARCSRNQFGVEALLAAWVRETRSGSNQTQMVFVLSLSSPSRKEPVRLMTVAGISSAVDGVRANTGHAADRDRCWWHEYRRSTARSGAGRTRDKDADDSG